MLHFPSPDIGMFGRRQRHVRGHRIPVTIVRSTRATPDTAVVKDTFGAHDVAPLRNGCPCCTVRVDLQAALRRRLSAREQRPFTRVAIESSEDAGPILRTFATPHALGAEFYVEEAPDVGGHSFALTDDGPIAWDAFSGFITTLQALRGADLVRVTGLLNVAGCRSPVAVHVVQHLVLPPVELQAWPDGNRQSRLTFVTRGVEEHAVRSMFDAVRALGS
jgi:G3E family GTPase